MKLIDNYKDLPIGKYLEVAQVLREEQDVITQQVRILFTLTDFTEDELLALPLVQYKALAGSTAFLYTPCQPSKRIPASVNLNGTILLPTPTSKISTAQYIDFQAFIKNEYALVELLSVFLVPKGYTYNEGYDITEVQGLIRDFLPVTEALALCAFFLKASRQLMKASQSSSEKTKRIVQAMLKYKKPAKAS